MDHGTLAARLGADEVAHETDVEDARAKRTRKLLAEAAAIDNDTAANGEIGKGGSAAIEAARLRRCAESALAHAESDATDARYTRSIETAVLDGRLYLIATHAMNGKRKAWPAGLVGPRRGKQ